MRGVGRTVGVIVAAILLTILPVALMDVREVKDYRMIVYAMLIIGLMLARPQGLFVWKRSTAATPRGTGAA